MANVNGEGNIEPVRTLGHFQCFELIWRQIYECVCLIFYFRKLIFSFQNATKKGGSDSWSRVVHDSKYSVIEENVEKNEKQKNIKRPPNRFSFLVLIAFILETIFKTC